MANTGHDHDWRNLSIGTPSLDNSQNPSRNGSFDGRIIYVNDDSGLEVGGLNIKSNGEPRQHDLTSSWRAGDDGPQHLSPSHGEDVAYDNRPRNRSISFDPQAKLDSGGRHAIDQPLPRTASLRSVTTAERPNSNRRISSNTSMQFDPATCKINPFTGEPVRRRPRRQDTASTTLSMMDMFARKEAPVMADAEAHFASLTSASTASPPHDQPPTPGSPGPSYTGSPTAISNPAFSPALESEPWPGFRSGSVRSAQTLPSRPMSLRKESRRQSRRTESSSFSPASAFLSKWGRESINSVAPDPDDEGQSFGMDNEYIIGRQIGYGGFSVVKEAFSISDQGDKRKHAVKIIRKNIQDKGEPENEKCQQDLEHEVGIWKYLSNDHILSLISVFDTDFATFCVMDLNEGGSLYDLIRDNRKAGKSASPELAKSYAWQLALAIRYLHEDVRIVHRDVKMENCLIDRDRAHLGDKPGNLRLCDFGLADFIASETPDMGVLNEESKKAGDAGNVVGSLEYAAPEVFKTERTILQPSVDIWAYAVCVYTLVVGDRPFKHSLAPKLLELISSATWDEQAVRNSSGADDNVEHVVDLLRGCLNPDIASRWTITTVLSSPWFADLMDLHAS